MVNQDWRTVLQEAVKAVTKTEDGQEYTADAYLVVPDPDKPSTWKLRIEEKPGKVTVAQLGRAAAALGPGFRGQRVDLEPDERRAAARKLIALYRKHDVADEDIPEYLWEIADMKKPEAKSINLRRTADEVQQRFYQTFAGLDAYPIEVFDDHLIVQLWGQPNGPAQPAASYFKVPFVATMTALPGDPDGQEVTETVSFAPRAEWVRVWPTFVTFETIKQADGKARWVMVSSGGFEDRDREIVSTAFLESAVKAADETGERGPLLIYHIPGSQIGTCDTQMVIGSPGFLLESGTFDDTEAGRRAAAYFAEHANEYGGSIRFVYNQRTLDGVYLPPGLILERSVLPRDRAAFPWSGVQVMEVEKMMGINEEKLAELKKILGNDLAEQIVQGLAASAEQLKATGIRWKEVQPDADAGREETVVAQEVILTPETVAAVAKEATDKALAQISPVLDALRQAVEKLASDVAALQREDDEKLAEKVRQLPRATVKALSGGQVVRPTQRDGIVSEQAKASALDLARRTLYGDE